MDTFACPIQVVPGDKYQLTLKFAETFFFDVYSNGVALLRDFDIYKEGSGENRAADQLFHDLIPNRQGRLILSFPAAIMRPSVPSRS